MHERILHLDPRSPFRERLRLPDDDGRDRGGEHVAHSAQAIALRREDARLCRVVGYFPRSGFMVVPA
jgi:hypothetical protein